MIRTSTDGFHIYRTYRSLILLLLIMGSNLIAAVAGTPRITATDISQNQARDGQTFTLRYKIYCDTAVQVSLGCTLHGPNEQIVEDDTHEGSQYDLTLSPGEQWYQRYFFLNMSPGAGIGYYNVEYGVSWGTNGFTSVTRNQALNILTPISVRIPILAYHKVGPVAYSEYWTTTDDFTAQMKAIKAYGYTAVALQDIMDYRAGIKNPPAKLIAITFDDAYENLLTDAYPAMVLAGIEKATCFVPTGRIGGDNSWDTGDNDPVIVHMTWDEARYLYGTGLMDMQSHTVSHPYLRSLGPSTLNSELTNSASAIKDELGYRPRFISWPYGQTSSTINKAARVADYFAGVVAWDGVEPTCANKWELQRVPIDWNTSTDYDPNNPSNFLFNKISSGVPVPVIAIGSIEYLDVATGVPLADNQVYRGSSVKVRVHVNNSGETSQVTASLKLDCDTDHQNGITFDSHAESFDITKNLVSGMDSYEWVWRVPSDAPPGGYYASVAFHDVNYVLGFAYSSPLWQGAFHVKSLSDVKTLANGAQMNCIRAPVSAAFPSAFYLQTSDRLLGIRVEASNHGMLAGDMAVVGGIIKTNPDGERYIEASIMQKDGVGSVRPIGMPNRPLGGGDGRYDSSTGGGQVGVFGGTGLNNIGLLVTTWGKITEIGDGYYYIDDGAGLRDGTKTGDANNVGIRVTCDPNSHQTGEFTMVTGISSVFKTPDGKIARLLLKLGETPHA